MMQGTLADINEAKNGRKSSEPKRGNSYCNQPLIHFSCRYVRDLHVAENIVQDVFLHIWQNRSKLNPTKNIKTYLYTAVRNQSFKHLRHVDVKQRSVEELRSINHSVNTPEKEWQKKELEVSIRKAINALPEKYRIIFSMNRFDHFTYTEIAEIQNISIKTVETQMGRALKYLRERLATYL